MSLSQPTKRQLFCAVTLTPIIALGVLSRAISLGWPPYDKSLGDVLYAMAAYFCLGLLLPRLSVGFTTVLGTVACLAVEFLQLSKVNAHLLKVPVLRWFLGRFIAHNW